ncbi:hypothetical protein P7K49_002353 [Saguinus oedipus]|uniref:EF-hand domain-containing protein n=1 Tax=Saguinus oedipus TaxID=9490 RepID=A0ABQ9WL19_SAGOE|nr:hypothetical protein P7K49_002353 [Saguinus oedipus]
MDAPYCRGLSPGPLRHCHHCSCCCCSKPSPHIWALLQALKSISDLCWACKVSSALAVHSGAHHCASVPMSLGAPPTVSHPYSLTNTRQWFSNPHACSSFLWGQVGITVRDSPLSSMQRQAGNRAGSVISFRQLSRNSGMVAGQMVLRQYGINLSEEEFFHILEYYDKTLSSKISYNDFLRAFLQ